MDLHIKLCKKYGISKKDLVNAEEKNKNIAYSRYVLESGYSGDFLDLITPLIPCVLGYAEIGNNLKNYKPSNQMYKSWIQTYSGEEYQKISKSVGRLFDSAVLNRLGKNFNRTHKWKSIQKKFKTAILLEIDFWEMALE
jgi:thiaminase/transcriptional activator TenA